MELEAKWDQVKVQTSWKLEPCFLAESQSTPPPSSTTTDAANTLLLTHIQLPSTDVEESLPSQSPVAIECTQSKELDTQVPSGSALHNSTSAHFILEVTEDHSQTLSTQ